MKQSDYQTVTVDENTKLVAGGVLVELKDVLNFLKYAYIDAKRDTCKIPPEVVRKYRHCLEYRDNILFILNESRKMVRKIEKKNAIRASEREIRSAMIPYIRKFERQAEEVMLRALELANLYVESARKEYENSPYYVAIGEQEKKTA
jgi:bisphosphoglycerate-independent phosphoglycerate mutase (AlkP superfamily)